MKIHEKFRLIEPEDDDRSLVEGLDIFYYFEEAEFLIKALETARSQEADGYLRADEMGDTAMKAYFADLLSQLNETIDQVAVVAAESLITDMERQLSL